MLGRCKRCFLVLSVICIVASVYHLLCHISGQSDGWGIKNFNFVIKDNVCLSLSSSYINLGIHLLLTYFFFLLCRFMNFAFLVNLI